MAEREPSYFELVLAMLIVTSPIWMFMVFSYVVVHFIIKAW